MGLKVERGEKMKEEKKELKEPNSNNSLNKKIILSVIGVNIIFISIFCISWIWMFLSVCSK